MAHALLAFLRGEEAAASDFDPLRRVSRNLSYEITETEESDRYGEEVSAPAARPPACPFRRFVSIIIPPPHPHSILDRENGGGAGDHINI